MEAWALKLEIPALPWVLFQPLCGSVSSFLLCRVVVDLNGIKYVTCLAKHLVKRTGSVAAIILKGYLKSALWKYVSWIIVS